MNDNTNLISETFRFYFKNLIPILRPAVFFLLPPLVALSAMVPGFITHFSLLLEGISSYTGEGGISPILSQRVSDFQMFLIPLILIYQVSGFFWKAAVSHLAGIKLDLIPSENDPGPAMAVVRKFLPLILTTILVGSLMMLTGFLSMFLLFLPTALISILIAFVPLTVMIENTMGGGALLRSFQLIRGRFLKTAGVMVISLVIGGILTLFLSLGAVSVLGAFVPESMAASLPAPGESAGGGLNLPEEVIRVMSIGYIISLGIMIAVKTLFEIPFTIAGVTLIYRRGIPAAPAMNPVSGG